MGQYLDSRDINNKGVDFWYPSIVEFIGLDFEEKRNVATEVFRNKNAGDDFTDYCEAICEMIDSYFKSNSLLEFQSKFTKKS